MSFGLTLLAGGIAGALCGLLGSGGGIPLLLMLRHFLPEKPRACFAMCVTVMLGLALTTVWQYHREGMLAISASAPMLFPSVAGGVLGAKLLGRVSTKLLGRLFAILCLIGGVRMLFF